MRCGGIGIDLSRIIFARSLTEAIVVWRFVTFKAFPEITRLSLCTGHNQALRLCLFPVLRTIHVPTCRVVKTRYFHRSITITVSFIHAEIYILVMFRIRVDTRGAFLVS